MLGVGAAIYFSLPDDDRFDTPPPPTETTAEEDAADAQADRGDRPDRPDRPETPEDVIAHDCGTCHTLRAADTAGITGPSLDETSPSRARVLRFIRTGSLDGVMPPNLLRGERARDVAAFVATNAGGGS